MTLMTLAELVPLFLALALAGAIAGPAAERKSSQRMPSLTNREICMQRPVQDSGRECYAFMPVFSFSYARGRCEMYIYRGCENTRNLFFSKQHCEEFCSGIGAVPCEVSVECEDEMRYQLSTGCLPAYSPEDEEPCCPQRYECRKPYTVPS